MNRLAHLKLNTHLFATDLGDLGAGEFFCPNCGAPITAADQKCPNCHFDLVAYRQQTTGEPADNKPASEVAKKKTTQTAATDKQKAADSANNVATSAADILSEINSEENPEEIFKKLKAASTQIAAEEPKLTPKKGESVASSAMESRRVTHALDKTKDISDLVDQVRAVSNDQEQAKIASSSAAEDKAQQAPALKTDQPVKKAVKPKATEDSQAPVKRPIAKKLEQPAEPVKDDSQAISATETAQEGSKPTTNEKKTNPEEKVQRSSNAKKQRSLRTWLGVLIALIIVLLIAFFWGKAHYSRQAQLDRTFTALATEKPSTVSDVMVSSNKNLTLNLGNSRPFVRYLRANKNYLATSKKQLKTDSKTTDGTLSFVKTGRTFIFDKYQLEIKPIYRLIKTDIPSPSIYLDGQNMTAKKENTVQKIGPFIPGKYTLTVTGETQNKTLKRTAYPTFLAADAQTIDLTLKPVAPVIQSNVADGQVYVNNEKKGDLKNGQLKLNSLTWQPDLKVVVKKTVDSKTYQSKAATISKNSDGQAIDASLPQFLTTTKAQNSLEQLYKTVSSETHGQNKSYQTNQQLANYFTQGASADWYSRLNKFIQQAQMPAGNIDYTDFAVKVNQVQAQSLTDATVNFDVTYTTHYLASSGKQPRIQTFRYTTAHLKTTNGTTKIVDLGSSEQKIADNNANS
ncbi:hypothetical protein BSQ39_03460 [Loigolactobacillus backii]|uniref:zinc ribbon domain-containing protein n=1 Tax=Loigolactobacillus backii TaxID=375175 RepID=UPI000C1C9890|nr:zinc ribbon domain-containing protein [Loigolactobacillus backii]PIO82695.1 hypothetical protein BSQ39_03460 [Loigolactobacillus backii]